MALLLILLVFGVLIGGAGIAGLFWHYGKELPNHKQLSDYQPPTSTRVHAGDGSLIGEFALEKRVFVPIEAIPTQLIEGFIAAEDKNFYNHFGVDPFAITRAMAMNVLYLAQGKRMIGASTITQQVAKNFLLTNEFSLNRKVKEAILAIRIENTLEKHQIMELYLNEIYLGLGAYGVAAAALTYFDKSLDMLEIHEIAYLAALPKAPNNYHPTRKANRALTRRNWVLSRMHEEGFITRLQMTEAIRKPLIDTNPIDRNAPTRTASVAMESTIVEADYFLESIRRELLERFGENGLYRGGLSARTSLDPNYQQFAKQALRRGLIEYDRRHGYRGALTTLDLVMSAEIGLNWQEALDEIHRPLGNPGWNMAVVLEVTPQMAKIGLTNGTVGQIQLADLGWARKAEGDPADGLGARVTSVEQVLTIGDVILVEKTDLVTKGTETTEDNKSVLPVYRLQQIPKVNGGLVALDPHTGRVLALEGGFNFDASEFNRVTQAERQPGSAIKPFVYLAALEQGYTPATIILDAPFVIDQGAGLGKWKPSNYSNKFYGPSLMRTGIEKSRNLMTVRLAQAIGMPPIQSVVDRFNVDPDLEPHLSMALGAGATRLIDMTAGYAMLVNGGREINPSLIDRVQDRRGKTLYRHDQRECQNCQNLTWQNQAPPKLPDLRTQLTDPIYAYQIVTMLEGAVQNGTGIRLKSLGYTLGGKTGTTNDSKDSWFVGFTPDLAVGVYTGFDTPISLGKRPNGAYETGSSVALPIFQYFMEQALKDKNDIPFRTPNGVRLVRIDRERGGLANQTSKLVQLEAFKPGTEPENRQGTLYIGGSERDFEQDPALPAGLY